jgi:CRISPR-associated protein Cas2
VVLLDGVIPDAEDHVLFVDIGPAGHVTPRVISLGKDFQPITREPVIV